MPENPYLSIHTDSSHFKHGMFAGTAMSEGDIQSIEVMTSSLREKIGQIREMLEKMYENKLLTPEEIFRWQNHIFGGSVGIKTNSGISDNPQLEDFTTFAGHDYAGIMDYPRGMFLSDNGTQEEFYTYYIGSFTALLACYENLLVILSGEQNNVSCYPAEKVLGYFSDILNRRLINAKTSWLQKKGLLDDTGKSVYIPFRLHAHLPENLVLKGSVGSVLLMAMYNWAKNSITQGELLSKAYSYLEDPFYDAMGKMLSDRIAENGGHVDVHMEIMEPPEAYIGSVSDTGAGFDLNALKKMLYELTKNEAQMTKFLQLGILSKTTFDSLHAWETDPREFGKILADLPSLLKMPRFSGFSHPKLQECGLAHSGIGLFGIEVSAQQHMATTFITEHHKGGACMIMVIPKDPEKYRKSRDTVSDRTRTNVGNVLFETPSHLLRRDQEAA